jgi:hypothetical protein
MYNGNDRINMAFHGSETIAESFDACPILYIGYDVHETSILCLKLVWLIKLWDILWWLSYDSYLKNLYVSYADLMASDL